MLRRLRQELEKYIGYDKGGRPLLVVAFSGGRDSVGLLAALDELRGDCGYELAAAHFNHCLRGAEADGDQEFCRDFCAARGITFHTVRRDVRSLAGGANIENTARRLRYEWLHSLCDACRGRGYAPVWLLTAHHQEDQAETVLLHLLRGGGSSGLAAMRPLNGELLRPLLGISRRDIEMYLAERHLPWREDSTNACPDMTRNRLRGQVMPLLRGINPQAAAALGQTAAVLAAEDDYFTSLLSEKMRAAVFAEGRAEYPLALLRGEHIAVQRRLVRLLWQHAAGSELCSLTFEQTEGILRLTPGKALHSAGGIEASVRGRRDDRRLVLRRFSDEELARRAEKSRRGQ